MRKSFVANRASSLESLNVDGVNIALLSDEELTEMAEQAADAKVTSDAEVEDAERFAGVVDALEDVADVIESNGAELGEDITPAEANLVDAAAGATVAGTDTPEEEVIPAMESFVGQNRRLAVESIREKASQLYKTVIDYLKKIWERIEEFFYKYVGEIPLMRRKLDALKKKVEDVASKSIKKDGGKTFKVTATSNLMVNNEAVKTVAGVLSALDTTAVNAAYVFGDYATKIKTRGEKLSDCIGDFDEDKAESSANDAIKILRDTVFAVPGSTKEDPSRFSGYKCEIGAGMFGNKSLCARWWADKAETGEVARLNRCRNNGLLVLPTVEKPKDAPSDITFNTMSNAEMSKVISKLEKLLDTVEQYRRGSKFKGIKEAREKMKNASSKATTAVKKLESAQDEDRNPHAIAIYKELINLNLGYVQWVKEPIESMIQVSLGAVRTSMMVVAKSCAQYE